MKILEQKGGETMSDKIYDGKIKSVETKQNILFADQSSNYYLLLWVLLLVVVVV